MKAIKVIGKNVDEIYTYLNDKNEEVLKLTRSFDNGEFIVRLPETDEEEKSMLQEMWADIDDRSYPDPINKGDTSIDLDDYSHDMVYLGPSSDSWSVELNGKDVSEKFQQLLDFLRGYEDSDYDDVLDQRGWILDLQYYVISTVSDVIDV